MSGALRTYYRGASLVSLRETPVAQPPATRLYHFDHQGTTQCLTDTTMGTVTDRYSADAWGVGVRKTGTSINRHWFLGLIGSYDVRPRLSYLRANYASYPLACWIGQSSHRKRYLCNNPASDPVSSAQGQFASAHRLRSSQGIRSNAAAMSLPASPRPSIRTFLNPFWEVLNMSEQCQRKFRHDCWDCATQVEDEARGFSSLIADLDGQTLVPPKFPAPDRTVYNAIQHCIGTCLAYRKCGRLCAALATTGHETPLPPWLKDHVPGSGHKLDSTFELESQCMDLYNNEKGKVCADGTTTCTSCCINMAHIGALAVINQPETGSLFPAQDAHCVGIKKPVWDPFQTWNADHWHWYSILEKGPF